MRYNTQASELSCRNCLHGRPNIVWVRYPDNALHNIEVVVCMKGLPLEAPDKVPWTLVSRPAEVNYPDHVCGNWVGAQ